MKLNLILVLAALVATTSAFADGGEGQTPDFSNMPSIGTSNPAACLPSNGGNEDIVNCPQDLNLRGRVTSVYNVVFPTAAEAFANCDVASGDWLQSVITIKHWHVTVIGYTCSPGNANGSG